MIVGTAGHVDHGKTSLVKALTGIDTDRLPEEKRRGITLELGFAHLTLPDGTVAGVVDVPGHERFVKAMAAGAGGVDLAILVVAADEGVMPQTREHLDICQLLGVRAGVVALTKADLLPGLGDDWRSLLDADLATLLAGSVLEKAEVVPVSARTGEGLDALRAALGRAAAAVPRRPADGPLFLPIDRAFTIKGFGTVVTGTLLSGTVEPEASVSLLPGLPGPFRVRGVQTHGQTVARGSAGQRTAVNLAGRGDPGRPARHGAGARRASCPRRARWTWSSPCSPRPRPRCPRRRTLLLHLGTAQVEARLTLLDLPELSPGETGLAQLRLQAPVAALPGPALHPPRGAAAARARGDARRRPGADPRRTPAAARRVRAARADARRGPRCPAGLARAPVRVPRDDRRRAGGPDGERAEDGAAGAGGAEQQGAGAPGRPRAPALPGRRDVRRAPVARAGDAPVLPRPGAARGRAAPRGAPAAAVAGSGPAAARAADPGARRARRGGGHRRGAAAEGEGPEPVAGRGGRPDQGGGGHRRRSARPADAGGDRPDALVAGRSAWLGCSRAPSPITPW